MDVLIVTNFCSDFSKTDNDRFLYIANMLSKEHKVEMVTSNFCHEKKLHRNFPLTAWPFKITFLQETGYPKNVCLRRFYSHWTWGKELKKYLIRRKKPDVIYCAIPSLSGPFAVAKYCEKNKVKFIVDVQDLWPEAFSMVFRIPVISDLVFWPFKVLVNGIYKRADEIAAVSETYVQRALSVNKKCSSGHAVFLGTELETFDININNNHFRKSSNELCLGYCGTLGASYDLTCVFDALILLREKGHFPPKFVVMGDGPRKEEFEKYAQRKDLEVVFTGRLPYAQMCGRLKACDITVNPIVGSSAASIINKHADYAASGLPVINTQESQEYRDLVDKYCMGMNCKNGDPVDMAEKLEKLIRDEALRLEMGRNARRCAEEKFDRKNTYKALLKVVENNEKGNDQER